MSDRYCHGDIIFIKDHNSSTINYGAPFVVITKEERYLKYVRRAKNEKRHVVLSSHNPRFDDFEVEREEILKMYRCLPPVYKPKG